MRAYTWETKKKAGGWGRSRSRQKYNEQTRRKENCKAQTCDTMCRLGRALRRGKEDEGRGEEGKGGGEKGGNAQKGSRAEWTTFKGNRDSSADFDNYFMKSAMTLAQHFS